MTMGTTLGGAEYLEARQGHARHPGSRPPPCLCRTSVSTPCRHPRRLFQPPPDVQQTCRTTATLARQPERGPCPGPPKTVPLVRIDSLGLTASWAGRDATVRAPDE